MADPSSNAPYDPHCMDDVLKFLEIENPTLDDFTTPEKPFLHPSSPMPHCTTDQIDGNTIDPLEDPFIRDFYNNDPHNSQLAYGNQSETVCGNDVNNSRPLSLWPTDPIPYHCSCCQSLREILHTNGSLIRFMLMILIGFDVTKLEIHGRLGMICHAVLTVEPGSNTPGPQYQMFEKTHFDALPNSFCKKSIEDVKQFLTQYCIDRSQAGFTMIKDPLSVFYQTLCVGFPRDENLYNAQPSSISGMCGNQMDQAGNSNNNQEKPAKPSLAVQRERTRNLTLKEIENYFHLPIEKAAKKMEFSATVVKKICRKYGLSRWPHRKACLSSLSLSFSQYITCRLCETEGGACCCVYMKQIQSMEKKISTWVESLSSNDPKERARAKNEIENLQREIAKFGEGSSKLGDD
ncbi:hypothetical protein Goshw_021379 [Gossypium schwendimanii]|uniref:RWP-RK domain-containing protein n=1 Tax=Gossypium schwendimanii TaxID=34291 RepID=A0A7J9L4W5_GOSSC|nr:hypothetical protein [Gossypium schwendimanii]